MSIPLSELEVVELQSRLEEAEETLRAIRSGEVDALVVEDSTGERVYTLQGADHSYRALIESIQQGALSLGLDGTILYCNRCFSEMVKSPHEKVVGARVFQFLHSSQTTIFQKLLTQGSSHSSQNEIEFETADGIILPTLVAMAPMPLPGTIALCMVVTDLTQQKQHQELKLANRRKDEFLAMLAHELRNPLAPILNAVAILQHLAIPDNNVKIAQEIINRQVNHLSHLVDDLLDVSRITMGKITLQKQPIEMSSALIRAVETCKPIVDSRHQRLILSLPPQRLRTLADPTRLAQIIGNLLTNAAKYTDEGGEISLMMEQERDDVVIRVRDNGIGIPADLLPCIFDLFIQGERSLARSEGGLGIGLTLVRRLAELHDGKVEAYSDGLGKGSEFVVRFPVHVEDPQSCQLGTCETVPPIRKPPLTILIVEDNRDGAESLGRLLRLMGHQVHIFYSGPDALEAVDSLRPQVALLDIGLPVLNGYEVATRLRELPELANATLIAMTGYGQEEDRQRSRAAGFDHHLVKPVALDSLNSLLANININ